MSTRTATAGDHEPEGHEGVEDAGEEEAYDLMGVIRKIDSRRLFADPCDSEERAEDEPLQHQVAEEIERDEP